MNENPINFQPQLPTPNQVQKAHRRTLLFFFLPVVAILISLVIDILVDGSQFWLVLGFMAVALYTTITIIIFSVFQVKYHRARTDPSAVPSFLRFAQTFTIIGGAIILSILWTVIQMFVL